MKGTLRQLIILLVLACLCLSGFFLVRQVLRLPFRATNDSLHKRGARFTLDILVPGGTHIDEKMTIGEVISIRLEGKRSPIERILRVLSDMIPAPYRYLADLLYFFFWVFCFMTLMRVFTFVGYSRALRWSLLLAGVTYYFMPDFSPGRLDDSVLLAFPLLIILLRAALQRGRKKAWKGYHKGN